MYAVQSFDRDSLYYTDSLEDAEDIYSKMCDSCECVQLLAGDPENWKIVMQNW